MQSNSTIITLEKDNYNKLLNVLKQKRSNSLESKKLKLLTPEQFQLLKLSSYNMSRNQNSLTLDLHVCRFRTMRRLKCTTHAGIIAQP